MGSGGPQNIRDNTPVSFPTWREALNGSAGSPEVQARYVREIGQFVGLCRRRHLPIAAIVAKQYLAALPASGLEPAREALRWYFKSAWAAMAVANSAAGHGQHSRANRTNIALAARQDLGGADWERDLIVPFVERASLWLPEGLARKYPKAGVSYSAHETHQTHESHERPGLCRRMLQDNRGLL